MTIYFMDGQFTKREDLKVSIDDRGYYFGDGVYEVIKVYGGKMFTAHEHFSRLFESAEKIKITIPFNESELMDTANELIKVNNISDGHLYIQVTRGSSSRQHNFPGPEVLPIVTAYAIETKRPVANMEKGIAVKSVEDIRWLRCDIKSLNLLGSVLAKQEAHEAGCFEAVLHRDGYITEGSSTNMFGIKDGKVYTHPASNLILNGITRQVVLSICYNLEIPVVEMPFTLEEAYEMDELFLTSTTSEVMPITTIDGRSMSGGTPGPITVRLQKAFHQRIPTEVTGDI